MIRMSFSLLPVASENNFGRSKLSRNVGLRSLGDSCLVEVGSPEEYITDAGEQRAVANDLIAQVVELAFGQALFIVGGAVERANSRAKHLRQQPLTKTAAQTRRRIGGNKRVPWSMTVQPSAAS